MARISRAEADALMEEVARTYWRERRERGIVGAPSFIDGWRATVALDAALRKRVLAAVNERTGEPAEALPSWPFKVMPPSCQDEVGDAFETVATFKDRSRAGTVAFMVVTVLTAWWNVARGLLGRVLGR